MLAGKYDPIFKDNITEKKYYDHFKIHKHKPIEPDILTAVFLAYVIHHSRNNIRRLPEYKGVEIDFAINICMPIDHIENNNLKSVFEKVFHWAELVGDKWDKNDKDFDPLNAVRNLENCSISHEPKVFAVPEAVASFASYLISLRKKRGLHAIIDLGGGTTDLSICNLFTETGKTYWYAARNLPKGTIGIERALSQHITDISNENKCSSKDIYECLESISANYMRDKSHKDKELNSIVLKELSDLRNSSEYKQTWGSAYGHLKIDTLWKNVEIFICGGGSNLPHADKVFSKPWWPNLHTEYSVSKLPVPDNYEPGKSVAPFERMSVAYGLAIPLPQLDNFTLPGGSPNHTPDPLPVMDLDHEDLYPKD